MRWTDTVGAAMETTACCAAAAKSTSTPAARLVPVHVLPVLESLWRSVWIADECKDQVGLREDWQIEVIVYKAGHNAFRLQRPGGCWDQ